MTNCTNYLTIESFYTSILTMESPDQSKKFTEKEIFKMLIKCYDVNAYPLILREVTDPFEMKQIIRYYVLWLQSKARSINPIFCVRTVFLRSKPLKILSEEQYTAWEQAINEMEQEIRDYPAFYGINTQIL